jgi:hypothetical protein
LSKPLGERSGLQNHVNKIMKAGPLLMLPVVSFRRFTLHDFVAMIL